MIGKIILEFDMEYMTRRRAIRCLREATDHANKYNDPEWKRFELMIGAQGYSLFRERISEKIESIAIITDEMPIHKYPEQVRRLI